MPRKVLMGAGVIMKCFGTRRDAEGKDESVYTNDGINWQKVKNQSFVPNIGSMTLCRDGKARGITYGGYIITATNTGKYYRDKYVSDVELIPRRYYDSNYYNKYPDINDMYLISEGIDGHFYYSTDYINFIKSPATTSTSLVHNLYYFRESSIGGPPDFRSESYETGKLSFIIKNAVDNTYKEYDISSYCNTSLPSPSYFINGDMICLEWHHASVRGNIVKWPYFIIYNENISRFPYFNYDASHKPTRYNSNRVVHLNLITNIAAVIEFGNEPLIRPRYLATSNEKTLFMSGNEFCCLGIDGLRSIDVASFANITPISAIYSPALDGFLAIFKGPDNKTKQGFSKDGINWEFSKDNITSLGFSF